MPDENEKYENVISFLGGMVQSLHPVLLQPAQYAYGQNITSRGGLVKTRPVWKKLKDIPAGTFNGASKYRLSGVDRIVYCVGGKAYVLNLESLAESNQIIALDQTTRYAFCQAERYMVIQDGAPSTSWANAKWPVILSDTVLIDQSTMNDHERTPKGYHMAYGHGRLYVATNYIYNTGTSTWSGNLGRVGFVAGDIIKPWDTTDVLEFTDNTYWGEGGRIILPQELGQIYGLALQKNIMSGVGQGPLIAFAERGSSSFSIDKPRSEWASATDSDMGKVLFSGTGSGCRSPWSLVNVNSDIVYRGIDGIRTLRHSVTNVNEGLTNDSLSEEIADVMELDDIESELNGVSSAYVDKRFFCTANHQNGIYKGVVSLDMSPVSMLGQQGSPIYDGVWTGLDVQQILSASYNGKERLFAFAKDSNGDNKLYYLDESGYEDEGSSRPVQRVFTGGKSWGNIFDLKTLKYIDIWLEDIKGNVDVTAYYRADAHPLWCQMNSIRVSSGTSGLNQRRNKIRLHVDTESYDSIKETALWRGYRFQICIEWTGHARLSMIRMAAVFDRSDYDLVNTNETAENLAAGTNTVQLDNYEYEI
jgi:hypothetical protein